MILRWCGTRGSQFHVTMWGRGPFRGTICLSGTSSVPPAYRAGRSSVALIFLLFFAPAVLLETMLLRW